MSLFLKQSKFKSGKIYLSIVDGYWKDGKVKQKVYQKLGYLEDLKKLFDDPIVHYKNYVSELKKEFETKITTTFDLNKDNDFEDDIDEEADALFNDEDENDIDLDNEDDEFGDDDFNE